MTKRKTGLEQYYILKNNKKLHYGYTTGTCAAAASKAAAEMLLSGHKVQEVELMTPKGIPLCLGIEEISMEKEKVSCAVRKDGGDDPDATHGILIFSSVKKIPEKRIVIDGGIGVGRVTKKGLEQGVGNAAINRVPREMIANEVKEICEAAGYEGGISVEISVPEGEEIAKKTFNPKLGIEGGISILGTSGIVIPMSEEALIASIRVEMEMKKANGAQYLLITPGNYGADFCRSEMKLNLDNAMKCSNYVGETIDMAVSLGIKGILFVAHLGKFIKVAGGIMNTHSRCADSRAEIMASNAIRAGVSLETAKKLLDTVTTDEAVSILNKTGQTEAVMKKVTEKIRFYLQNRANGMIETEAVIFSNEHGFLGKTEGADRLLDEIKADEKR
ncbi:MAG: cobalamin biosynthesis protein CbiD [Clostridiales bacterium]|nr:cobalamin biosynthesis protein CbiD [Clostridiales bacterium]